MTTQRRHDLARRKLAGRVGGLLLASALLPFIGLATAQAADVSSDDSRALLVTGNVNACPSGTFELGSGDYESTRTAKELTITAVDAGTTVTRIYIKGGPDAHLYEPGKRGLTVNPPWVALFSPDKEGRTCRTSAT